MFTVFQNVQGVIVDQFWFDVHSLDGLLRLGFVDVVLSSESRLWPIVSSRCLRWKLIFTFGAKSLSFFVFIIASLLLIEREMAVEMLRIPR